MSARPAVANAFEHAFAAVKNAAAKSVDGKVFPLTLGPLSSEPKDCSPRVVEANKELLLDLVREYGAVLLRGFSLNKAEDFGEVVQNLGLENMPYVGGAAVRRNIVGDYVFTANESPPSEPIPFHHEMAQVSNPPRYVMFFCEVAPTEGGETPLINSHEVYKFFAKTYPEVCRKTEELGVRYVRTMPEEDDETSAIGRSWKNTFLVKSRAEVEAKMREMGHEWEWLPNGDLKNITNIVPAIRSEPGAGHRKTFFNSMVAAFKGWVDSRNDPLKAVMFGDGTPIDPEALQGVADFMEREKVAVPWMKGDAVIVDNAVAMHSRNTYDSPRRVLASVGRSPLGGTYSSSKALEDKAVNTPVTVRLPNGDFMPRLGLGLWKVPKEATAGVVVAAIKAGVRHLDCACDYANEKEVGDGIQEALSQGLVKREDLFVVSKLWNTYHGDHVEAACRKTLDDLQLDYVDLYMIHFPIPQKFVPFEKRYPPEWFFDPEAENPRVELSRIPISKTWRNMEALVTDGLARSIGVCNFNIQTLREMMSYAKYPPAVLQVEIHPLNSQEKLVTYAAEQGIQVVAFSPLAHSSYVEIGFASETQSVLTNPDVEAIAAKHGGTPHQVLLRWALQRGTQAVFKSSKPDHIASNLEAFSLNLDEEDMDKIDALNLNLRFNDPGKFCEREFNTFCPIYE
ncbi:Probable NAD(P)H-dependent D-xylose reductase xyl1 (XR) [Durusdinium trenchii]|uniref:Probable NAD(P)H-dependent D-xylose reductase xyl1 (XR) n=1 Tax=Durusdinium trenchii TaxID=1381693 RepID=A0ABP0J5D7_9DINO